MDAGAVIPRFSVFVEFQRGRLMLRRGVRSLEAAVAFAEGVASLRFRNPERVFIVDDSSGAVIWRARPMESLPASARPDASRSNVEAATAPQIQTAVPAEPSAPGAPVPAEMPDARVPTTLPIPPAPGPSSPERLDRLIRAVRAARTARERYERTLAERIATLRAPGGERAEALARVLAIHEQCIEASGAFASNISLMELRIAQLRRVSGEAAAPNENG